MDVYYEVLYVIAHTPQPEGWYGIAQRLGMKGVVLNMNLVSVLRDLVERGYLSYEDAPGSHGLYYLTDAGKEYLQNRHHTKPPGGAL